MKVIIEKSDIKGKVVVPSSKSMTIRALICAALAKGESEILNPLDSDDTSAAVDALTKMGTVIVKEPGAWRVTGGRFRMPPGDIDCGESATTMRFLTAIVSLAPGDHRLVGGPTLSRRPIRPLVDALKPLGVKAVTATKVNPPVTVTGGTFVGGTTEIAGNISSQFISALLLVAPFAKVGVSIRLTTPLTSRPYVLMTLWCLKKFGINVLTGPGRFVIKRQKYQPAKISVDGDWSSASYFLALGAVSEGGLQIDNINTSSLQGDRVMLEYIRGMGARVVVSTNSVTVSYNKLRGIHADLSDCIDLLPTMAVLAALAEGKSTFLGIDRARLKESDRVAAVREGLTKMGVTVIEEQDRMIITGLKTPKQASDEAAQEEAKPAAEAPPPEKKETVIIKSYGDHRIAMAFSVAGASLGGYTIEGAECVTKTFPKFWEEFKEVGGKITQNE